MIEIRSDTLARRRPDDTRSPRPVPLARSLQYVQARADTRVQDMQTGDWLAVTQAQALRFFFERLRDVVDEDEGLRPSSCTTRACSRTSRPRPRRPPGRSPSVPRASRRSSTCSCSTGASTSIPRSWKRPRRSASSSPDSSRTSSAAATTWSGTRRSAPASTTRPPSTASDRARSRMMERMAARFDYWRRQQNKLAHELRDWPKLIGKVQ